MVAAPIARDVARLAGAPTISSRMPDGLLAALPFGLGAQQVLLGDHLQDRPDVLRHAAVDQHQAVLQLAPRLGDTSSVSKMRWLGSRRPRLMPNSGSPSPATTPWISFMPGQTPPESCQPPPEPPSHSPRIARAATSRRSSSRQLAGERARLAGGAHADGDQRRPAGSWKPPAASPWGCR